MHECYCHPNIKSIKSANSYSDIAFLSFCRLSMSFFFLCRCAVGRLLCTRILIEVPSTCFPAFLRDRVAYPVDWAQCAICCAVPHFSAIGLVSIFLGQARLKPMMYVCKLCMYYNTDQSFLLTTKYTIEIVDHRRHFRLDHLHVSTLFILLKCVYLPRTLKISLSLPMSSSIPNEFSSQRVVFFCLAFSSLAMTLFLNRNLHMSPIFFHMHLHFCLCFACFTFTFVSVAKLAFIAIVFFLPSAIHLFRFIVQNDCDLDCQWQKRLHSLPLIPTEKKSLLGQSIKRNERHRLFCSLFVCRRFSPVSQLPIMVLTKITAD